MARLPFYAMVTLGFLGLFMAFVSGSDMHFAVSAACSAALGLQLMLPVGRPVAAATGGGRLDVVMSDELPPMGDEPVARPRAASGRGRAVLVFGCLAVGYLTLACAWLRPTVAWGVSSVACSAATLLLVPRAVSARASKSARRGRSSDRDREGAGSLAPASAPSPERRGFNFELWVGSLRMGLSIGTPAAAATSVAGVAPTAAVETERPSIVERPLDFEEIMRRAETIVVTQAPSAPAPQGEELVGEDVAASLRKRWGIPVTSSTED